MEASKPLDEHVQVLLERHLRFHFPCPSSSAVLPHTVSVFRERDKRLVFTHVYACLKHDSLRVGENM